MERICEPELLDQLPPEDEGAIGSRRDLRRLNWWMGNAGIMAGAFNRSLWSGRSFDLLEIGAGDGDFLAKVLARVSIDAERKRATLLDQQKLLTQETARSFAAVGWETETIQSDIFDWFEQTDHRYDAVVANLFLHHFTREQLAELFAAMAKRTRLFIAVEPRRAKVSVLTGLFLWAVGCNAVTRHDAKVSIRAGIRGRELTELWPKSSEWKCEERRAGFASHLFVAKRLGAEPRTGTRE